MASATLEVYRARAGHAARTCAWVARSPSYGRDVFKMLPTLGKNPLDLRQAWLPFGLMTELDAFVDSTTRVFEFGGGGSTAWFADRVGEVVTVEHEAAWFAMLRERMGPLPNVSVSYCSSADSYSQYVASIDDYPDDSFDVIVVDGRERVRCFSHAIPKLRPGGWLLIDDVERQRYSPVFGMVDWPRRVIRGFAPCKPTLAHTAVFARPAA